MTAKKILNGRGAEQVSKRSRGFTLIEVLITMLVISIGVLGVAATQLQSLQFAHSSFQRSVAVLQASDLAERLWAGLCDLPGGLGNITTQWEADHAGVLPGGLSPVVVLDVTGRVPTYQITIRWSDGRAVEAIVENDGTINPAIFSFVHYASIPLFECEP